MYLVFRKHYLTFIFFQNIETITITPSDSRWVGAWWLGYLIAGVITLLSAIPFWFLPRSLPVPGPEVPEKCTPEQTSFIKGSPLLKHKYSADEHTSFIEMAKGKEVYRLLGVMFLYMSYVENNVSQSTLYLGLTLHNLAVITHFLCVKVSTSHILDEELLIHHIAKSIHSLFQITEFRCSRYFHGHKCIKPTLTRKLLLQVFVKAWVALRSSGNSSVVL